MAEQQKKELRARILALDPATHCGWAHSGAGAGTWDLSVRKDESGGMRLIRFRAKLNEVLAADGGLDLVVYEGARFVGFRGGDRALRTQAQLEGVLLTWCEDKGLQYRAYSPAEIKKFATGKGNAKKDVILATARRAWPECKDDNEADARFLLELARKEYGGAT